MHAAPTTSRCRHRLLVAGAGLLLLTSMGVVAWTASARSGGETQTASQPTGVPQDTPSATDALSGSRACERHVTQALARYARVRLQGQDTGLALGVEQGRLSPLEYQAFSSAVNDLDTRLASQPGEGLAVSISIAMPPVRRICQAA